MALNKLLLYLSAITIATLFNGSAHGAAAELQSALANWDISFVAFTANFNQNNDGDDLVSEFEIGKNQVVEVELFAKDCITPIIGSPITLNGDPTRTNKDDNHDVLRIAHTITKGALVGSNVWNGDTNKLEICQKTKLVLKVDGDSSNDIVVVEDRRKFVVNLDLTMDFEVNSTLRTENQPMLMIVFNAALAVEGIEQPSDNRTLYHAADLLARSIVELVGESPRPNRGEVGGVIPLAMNFPPTELYLPNPLPDWKAMPQMRRGMLIITDRSDQKEEGEEADAPLGGERTLQASNSSTVKFEVTLMEPCDNETHCYELMNTTTFYSDVTTYMDQEIESGRFTTLLQENVAKYPLTRRRVNEMAQQDDALAEKEGETQEEESDALASVHSFDNIMNQNHGQRKLSISTANVTGATFSSPVMTMEMNEGQVFNASGSTDVISYVKACKCGGWESFTCNSDVLEENGELNICISSIRASEVETDFIESMIINQADQASLDVIKNTNVESTSLTSVQYATNQDGIVVSTRVPSNMFSFGNGNAITVTGVVHMKLSGGSRRKLQIGLASGDVVDEDAPFQVTVKLGGKQQFLSQEIKEISASGTAVGNKLAVMFGMVFGLTLSMFG